MLVHPGIPLLASREISGTLCLDQLRLKQGTQLDPSDMQLGSRDCFGCADKAAQVNAMFCEEA